MRKERLQDCSVVAKYKTPFPVLNNIKTTKFEIIRSQLWCGEANSCLQRQKILKQQEPRIIWIFSDKKTLSRIKNSIEGITDGYPEILRMFQWICTQSFQQLWHFWESRAMSSFPNAEDHASLKIRIQKNVSDVCYW